MLRTGLGKVGEQLCEYNYNIQPDVKERIYRDNVFRMIRAMLNMSDSSKGDLCSERDPAVPIRNFRRVTPWLFRGGQPGTDGIKALTDLGIKTVISLRWGRSAVEIERRYVEEAGMRFFNVRLNYWFLPSQETINQFFSLIDSEESRPIFVHCLHGADRTGLVIAMFRMTRQGWTVQEAYREMKMCGFHRFRVRNFKWMLWRFARKLEKQNQS